MTASFVVVVPAIDPDLIRTCITSMSARLRERLLLVDNTFGKIAEEHRDHVMCAGTHDGNIGVPRSWNQGVACADLLHADYLIIVSQSIRFGASGGADFLGQLDQRAPDHLMHSQFGWKCIALNMRMVHRVGIFDPVFSPAYYEESDWLFRAHLAGLPCPLYNDGEYDQVNIDAESEGDALTLRRGLVTLDYQAQLAKYVRKHGGPPCHETYDHPYNDPTLHHTHTGPPPS
jgi:hypothetical protein